MKSLKRLRQAHGLSLRALAEETGLPRESIARFERPATDPKASTLRVLARALRVPVCALFEEETPHATHRQRRRR
jgi:transcriptional regulator with XRE-family HTH domain